jgi:hypothetical protein
MGYEPHLSRAVRFASRHAQRESVLQAFDLTHSEYYSSSVFVFGDDELDVFVGIGT